MTLEEFDLLKAMGFDEIDIILCDLGLIKNIEIEEE